MKQYNLINSLMNDLIKRGNIDCAFLVGSFGRQREDDKSNIDLYIVLKEGRYEEFVMNLSKMIDSLGKVLYSENRLTNHYLMSTLVIYEDNIMLNLYNIDLDEFDYKNVHNDILKLYDPKNMLDKVMAYNLEFSEARVGELIQEFSLEVFEFNRYYLRHDLAIMFDICIKAFDKFSYVFRYYNEKETSKLGKKEILASLTQENRMKYVEIIRLLKYDSLKDAMVMMADIIADIIGHVSLKVASKFNYDLFMHVYKRLKSI